MPRNRRPTAAALATLAVALLLLAAPTLAPRTAEAHANLVRSTPAAGVALDQAPEFVEIEFSERVAPGQSYIRVFNVRGERVDLDDLRAVDDGPLTLRVRVQDGLPEGTYTVAWQNLSDVDGHSRTGGFAFFVGEPAFAPVVTGGVDRSPLIRPADAAARWTALVGLVLMGGVPWIFRVVFAARTQPRERRTIEGRIRWLVLLGGALVLFAAAVQLTLQLTEVGGSATSLILDTRWGNAWLLRVVLTCAALGAWQVAQRSEATGAGRHVHTVAVALALAAALTVSYASHGAAASGIGLVAGLIDAAHVLATVAWAGGLVALLLVLVPARGDRNHEGLLKAVLPRFTILGAVATATLAVTGTYAGWLHAGSWDALATDYGRGIVTKVVLLAALIAIAGVNTTWVRRRLAQRREAARATRWLRRLVRMEVGLIALVLVATAVMTSGAPARQQVDDEQRMRGLVTAITDSGVEIEVAINPARVGLNEVTVDLRRNGEAYEDVAVIELSTRNIETAFGAEESFLSQTGPGRWSSIRPTTLSIDGLYEFALRIERDDGIDLRDAIRFDTTASRETAGLSRSRAWWLGLAVLATVGAALITANTLGSRLQIIRGETMGWIGAGVMAVAVLLITQAPEPTHSLHSPIPADADSLVRGEAIYVANCVQCHGEGLRGDGPDAATLGASDLVLHVPHHTDREHFTVIAGGRGAMPPWQDILTEDEIWHVINYLRAQADPDAPALRGQ